MRRSWLTGFGYWALTTLTLLLLGITWLLRTRRVEEAITLFEEVLADRLRILGPDHPNTLASRHDLANTYWKDGRYRQALRIFEEAANSATRLFGPTHEVTRQLIANRDFVRQQLGL